MTDRGTQFILFVVDKYLQISILKPVAVAEWLAQLTDMPDVSRSALSSYLWGVLVLLVSVQILVRLDCFSHSITMEV